MSGPLVARGGAELWNILRSNVGPAVQAQLAAQAKSTLPHITNYLQDRLSQKIVDYSASQLSSLAGGFAAKLGFTSPALKSALSARLKAKAGDALSRKHSAPQNHRLALPWHEADATTEENPLPRKSAPQNHRLALPWHEADATTEENPLPREQSALRSQQRELPKSKSDAAKDDEMAKFLEQLSQKSGSPADEADAAKDDEMAKFLEQLSQKSESPADEVDAAKDDEMMKFLEQLSQESGPAKNEADALKEEIAQLKKQIDQLTKETGSSKNKSGHIEEYRKKAFQAMDDIKKKAEIDEMLDAHKMAAKMLKQNREWILQNLM